MAVRTTLPPALIGDYVGVGLDRTDPWIGYCAKHDAPDSHDLHQTKPSDRSVMTPLLRSVLHDHGVRFATLIPSFGGHRPGGFVVYAHDREQVTALRDPRHLHKVMTLAMLTALYWRPEDATDARPPLRAGAYRLASPLTQREREVLLWLSDGLSTAGIAHRMGIEAVTVSKHLASARRHLDARTREQAVAIAVRDRLLHP